MPKQRGLPSTARMRYDHHFVEQLAARHTEGIGQKIPMDSLLPNPHQPRLLFEAIDELVASIQEVGVLEPLLVRQSTQGFQIISGERRYRAAVDAGLDEIPCIVLDVDDARLANPGRPGYDEQGPVTEMQSSTMWMIATSRPSAGRGR